MSVASVEMSSQPSAEDEARAASTRRALFGIGNAVANIAIAAAVIFLGWSGFRAVAASQAHYSVTVGQRTFATRYCVSVLGGTLGSAYVSKPDLIGSTGPLPRLVIRCSFGRKAYLMKVVDLTRSTETPRAGS